MGIEIERKFLVTDDSWRTLADTGTPYEQGYLSSNRDCSIRVRIEGEQARLNIKSATLGIVRTEYEYGIPVEEARELLDNFCGNTVTKIRYLVPFAGRTWEVDVFSKENTGLVVAEIELENEEENPELPPWAGEEVSGDPRYYNTELSRHPYSRWQNGDNIAC